MKTMLTLAADLNLTITKNWQGGSVVMYSVWDASGNRVFCTLLHADLMNWLRSFSA